VIYSSLHIYYYYVIKFLVIFIIKLKAATKFPLFAVIYLFL